MELIIVTTSEESLHLWNNFETPALSVMMRHIAKLVVLPSDVERADPSIVMSNQDLVIHVIQRGAMSEVLQIDLSHKLELSLG